MPKSTKQNGTVYLVGAGPGDLGLVTLRAKECIENADVIVYDHLANPELLRWARNDAEIIYAGKESGESRTQHEINTLLIDKAGIHLFSAAAPKKRRRSPMRESHLKLCLASRRPSRVRLMQVFP